MCTSGTIHHCQQNNVIGYIHNLNSMVSVSLSMFLKIKMLVHWPRKFKALKRNNLQLAKIHSVLYYVIKCILNDNLFQSFFTRVYNSAGVLLFSYYSVEAIGSQSSMLHNLVISYAISTDFVVLKCSMLFMQQIFL